MKRGKGPWWQDCSDPKMFSASLDERRLTSPPPTTRTFLPLTCHASIRLPPGCTAGNWETLVVISSAVTVNFGR